MAQFPIIALCFIHLKYTIRTKDMLANNNFKNSQVFFLKTTHHPLKWNTYIKTK